MANQRVVEMIIAAKNATGAVFDEAQKGLGGVGKSAESAGKSLDMASDKADSAGDSLQQAGRKGEESRSILDRLAGVVQSVSQRFGESAAEAAGFGSAAHDANAGGTSELAAGLGELEQFAIKAGEELKSGAEEASGFGLASDGAAKGGVTALGAMSGKLMNAVHSVSQSLGQGAKSAQEFGQSAESASTSGASILQHGMTGLSTASNFVSQRLEDSAREAREFGKASASAGVGGASILQQNVTGLGGAVRAVAQKLADGSRWAGDMGKTAASTGVAGVSLLRSGVSKLITVIASVVGRIKQAVVGVKDLGEQAAKTGKGKISAFLHNLANLATVAGAVKGAFDAVTGAFGESFARSAERGDAASLKLLGSMGKARQEVDKLVAAVVQQLLPAIIPLITTVAEVASATAGWVKESKVVDTVIQVVIGATVGLLRALDKASLGFEAMAEVGRIVFARAMAAVQGAVAKTIETLASMIREAAVFSQVLDQDVADSLFRTMDRLDKTAKSFRQSEEASKATTVAMVRTKTSLGEMADSLEKVSDKIATSSNSSKQAGLEMLAFSEQGMARLEAMMQVELARVGENREARLAILRKYQGLEVQAGREGSQRMLELQTEISTLETELVVNETQARLAQELELNQDSATKQAEIWDRYIEKLKTIFGERSIEVIEAETQGLLLRKQANEEYYQGALETLENHLARERELVVERTEQQVEDLDFQRELGAEEAAIIDEKILLYERLAANAQLTAEQRKAAEKSVTQLQREQQKLQLQSAQETSQRHLAIATAMATALVETTGGMKERISAVFKQMAANVLQTMMEQATKAVSIAAQQAAGVEAATVRERMAALGPIGAIVAKAHAHIPFVGPVIAAAVLAAFMALAKKVVHLNTGGAVSPLSQPQGVIPGTGYTDTVDAKLTAGEFVVNKEATSRIGPDNLAYMNETGQFPPGVGGSGGAKKVMVEVSFKDVGDSRAARFLTEILELAVKEYDLDVHATRLVQP